MAAKAGKGRPATPDGPKGQRKRALVGHLPKEPEERPESNAAAGRVKTVASKLGVSPGGAIMIHGLPNNMSWVGAAHRLYDWTLGCIAVTDEEIDEIWNLVPVGTPVEIRP